MARARRSKLTIPMRDAWALAAAAIEAGHLDEARILADHAAELSGWDRYDLVIQAGRHSAFDCRDLPRGWCYVAAAGSRRMLLVHPDAAEFAMDVCCSRLRREVMEHAMGLQRLETLLIAEMDEQSLAAIPDDLSELLP